MKKIFYFLLFSLASIGSSYSQIPSGNLVARYTYTGNANDASGNGLNGTVTGASLTLDHTGSANGAYSFSAGNHIDVASQSILNTGFSQGITLAAWVNIPAGSTATARIIDRTAVGDNSGYLLDIVNGNVRFIGNLSAGANLSSSKIGSGWTHIAATYDNTTYTLTFYINGVASGSYVNTARTVPFSSSSLPLKFGEDQNSGSQLIGSLDEPTIYGRPLSACEIRQLGGFPNQLSTPNIVSTTNICVGDQLVIANNTAGGTWSSSNTAVATVSSNGIVQGFTAGTADITYSVTTGGCNFVSTSTITVGSPNFTITGSTLPCPNSSSLYTVSPIVSTARYYWVVDNNVSMYHINGQSTQISVFYGDHPGTSYTVKAVALNLCVNTIEKSLSVTVNPSVPAHPVLSCSGGASCPTLNVNDPGSSVTKQWYVDGVLYASGVTSITRTPDKQIEIRFTLGTCTYSAFYFPAYCVGASLRLGATQSSQSLPSNSNDKVDNSSSPLKIYPNPNQGTFTFQTKGYVGKALIINSVGTVVQEIILDENQTSYNISATNLAKGFYMLKLTGGIDEYNGSFVIE